MTLQKLKRYNGIYPRYITVRNSRHTGRLISWQAYTLSATYLSTYCKVVLITSEVLGRVTDTLKPYQLFTCCHLEKCVYMIKLRASSTKTYFSVSLTIMFLHWLRSFGGFSSTLRTPFSSICRYPPQSLSV